MAWLNVLLTMTNNENRAQKCLYTTKSTKCITHHLPCKAFMCPALLCNAGMTINPTVAASGNMEDVPITAQGQHHQQQQQQQLLPGQLLSQYVWPGQWFKPAGLGGWSRKLKSFCSSSILSRHATGCSSMGKAFTVAQPAPSKQARYAMRSLLDDNVDYGKAPLESSQQHGDGSTSESVVNFDWPSLRTLDVSSNPHLSGALPASLARQQQLAFLNVSHGSLLGGLEVRF